MEHANVLSLLALALARIANRREAVDGKSYPDHLAELPPLLDRQSGFLSELPAHRGQRLLAVFQLAADAVELSGLPGGLLLADERHPLKVSGEVEAEDVVGFHATTVSLMSSGSSASLSACFKLSQATLK